MPLADKYKGTVPQPRKGPVWLGPESPEKGGGITFSLLSRFLVCRERFRLHTVEGLVPSRGFNHKIEFGNLWHTCEEVYGKGVDPLHREAQYPGAKELTYGCLLAAAEGMTQRWKESAEQIAHWYNICKLMWPLYLEHWKKHPDVKGRKVLMSEEVFRVPYTLPSGRTVYLRGKWDSTDLIEDEARANKRKGTSSPPGWVYLQENKTKGDINEEKLQRHLNFDLQTMLYAVAFTTWQGQDDYGTPVRTPETTQTPFRGVRYNVIRRPMHRQGKKESSKDFYDRLRQCIIDEPEHFFMRWKVDINQGDISRFKAECLNPVLDQLCDWWEYITAPSNNKPTAGTNYSRHWRHPFGVYNVLDEGGSSDLDYYLATGNETGLVRLQSGEELFPELE